MSSLATFIRHFSDLDAVRSGCFRSYLARVPSIMTDAVTDTVRYGNGYGHDGCMTSCRTNLQQILNKSK